MIGLVKMRHHGMTTSNHRLLRDGKYCFPAIFIPVRSSYDAVGETGEVLEYLDNSYLVFPIDPPPPLNDCIPLTHENGFWRYSGSAKTYH